MASLSPDDFRRHVLNGAAERVCSFLLYSEERIQMYLMSQKKKKTYHVYYARMCIVNKYGNHIPLLPETLC